MRPKCLCFVYVSPDGLKNIRTYPEVLRKRKESKIILASFPKDPTKNNFTIAMSEGFYIASYFFSMSGETKSNFFFLVAAYKKPIDNPDSICEYFTKTLDNYKDKGIYDLENIANTLPDIYNGLKETCIQAKVSGSVIIEIEATDRKKPKKPKKDEGEKFQEDAWND